MNEFDVIKENLPKFDFNVYEKIISSLYNIIDNYSDLYCDRWEYVTPLIRINSITDKDIEIEILFKYSDHECSTAWEQTLTLPIEQITDEKYMKDVVRKKKEKEEREKAEAEKRQKEYQNKVDYENYLKLKEKFESNGENK